MKISKYQLDKNVLNSVSFDDYHEAIEDALAIYKYQNKSYIVINIDSLKEDDGSTSIVVFRHIGFFRKIELEDDLDIVTKVLELYENE